MNLKTCRERTFDQCSILPARSRERDDVETHDESLGISDVGEITGELEVVDDLRSCRDVSLDSKAQDSSETGSWSDETLGNLVGRMRSARKKIKVSLEVDMREREVKLTEVQGTKPTRRWGAFRARERERGCSRRVVGL